MMLRTLLHYLYFRLPGATPFPNVHVGGLVQTAEIKIPHPELVRRNMDSHRGFRKTEILYYINVSGTETPNVYVLSLSLHDRMSSLVVFNFRSGSLDEG